MTSETIIIIGASYGGLMTAHTILKTLPTTSPDSKIILINPTTKFYWNVASPRLVTSDILSNSDLLLDFLPAFSAYPTQNFTFIQGSATSITPSTSTVTLTTSTGESQSHTYTHLVIASGSSGPPSTPWKYTPGTDLEPLIASTKSSILAATSIIVSGGGATAIETAGELATEHPSKKLTLIASDGLLPDLPSSAGAEAERQLKARGVEIVKGRVVDTTEGGVKLEDGKIVEGEYYLPAWGIVPNNSYIPAEWLNEKGWLNTDGHLRAQGTTNVWGVGDIVDVSAKNIGSVNETSAYVGALLRRILDGSVKAEEVDAGKEKKFELKMGKMLMRLVPIGKEGGTGYLVFFRPWSWLIAYMKSKDFMVSKAALIVGGEKNSFGTKL